MEKLLCGIAAGRRPGGTATAFFLALATFLLPSTLVAHVQSMSIADLAAVAPHVVVAVVEKREVRWNARHTLLVTGYTLRVEERLRGEAPDRVAITVPGGTLGNLADETCVTVHLEPGGRYLLFLGRLDRPSLTPILGAGQGMFREIEGHFAAPGEGRGALRLDGRPVRFGDLVAAVRPLAAKELAAPPSAPPSQALPFKAWKLAPEEKYVYHETAKPPIVVNPLPPGSPFSPWDQREMAYWNLYAGDLFRVSPTPTADWAFGNGVSDIAGFPPDDQMETNFGTTWGEIVGTLGITITHKKDGVLTEADVALNPNYAWTLDDRVGQRHFAPYPFKEVILHELGHVWGLHHPTESRQPAGQDSVMHYKDKPYYVVELFADDASAVRAAYPPGADLRDGLISSYVTEWNESGFADYIPARPAAPSIRRGRSVRLTGPIKIENPGTVPLENPRVEVYLAPTRLSFKGAKLIKQLQIPGAVPAGGVLNVDVGDLAIPAGARAGTYYLAFFLRDPEDAYQANNGAWSNEEVTLKVTRR
jgi:hypothetical protein